MLASAPSVESFPFTLSPFRLPSDFVFSQSDVLIRDSTGDEKVVHSVTLGSPLSVESLQNNSFTCTCAVLLHVKHRNSVFFWRPKTYVFRCFISGGPPTPHICFLHCFFRRQKTYCFCCFFSKFGCVSHVGPCYWGKSSEFRVRYTPSGGIG